VVGGYAVLEAVRAAGILRHVAADGTRGLTRGIGDVVESVAGGGLREPGVDDAGLDDRAAAFRPDLQDPVHPGEGDKDRAGFRERPA
jgi:hypothetical protein